MAHGLLGQRKMSSYTMLDGEAFRRRYRRLVIATWTLPVVTGTLFEIFMGLVTAQEVLLTLFAGFSGLFVATFLIIATIALDRRAKTVVGLVDTLAGRPAAEAEIKTAVRRLLALHIGLFLFLNIAGPQTTLLTDYFLYPDKFSQTTSFGLLIGILPPILLIALPLFFLVTDTLGQFLAPRGVIFDLAPLRLKYVVLGLVTPALVDMTLLLYFYDRTSYFRAETLFVWAALLVVAGLGTALAWRSLGQSLAPLREGLLSQRLKGADSGKPLIHPQSLDELGLLAVDWNMAVERERQQESRFRDLVEGSIQGICVNRAHEIIFANQALADILGYESAADVVALGNVLNFVHPDDRQRLYNYYMMRMSGGSPPNRYEFRAVAKDESTIWVEHIASLVQWGGETAVQSTMVDITDRKRAEDSLRESEARFRDLIEGSIQGIFVHRDFKLLFANRAMAEILGCKSVEDFLAVGSFLEFIPVEDRAQAEEIKSARMEGGDVPERYELRTVRPDGSIVWLENVARAVNWDGEPAIQAAVVDVTERKLAEEALRRSEDSMRRAQHISKVGSWERDFGEGELYWSDEMYELFGLERGLVNPSYDLFMRYVHPDDRDALRDSIDRALADEAPYDIDFRVVRPNGEQIVLHAQGEIDRDADGRPVYFRGTAQDVTKLREAEAQVLLLNEDLEETVERRTRELRETQAELIKKQRLATLGQLTATVSHELRNPLGAMRTSVFVLEKSLPAGSEAMQRALARIERGILRCDRIVDELLDFTRSTTVNKEPIAVDRWLAGVLSEQPVPEGIEVCTDMRLGGLAAMMDPGRMRRAVINVVENASQALTGKPGREGGAVGGRITVVSEKVGANIEIRIADNGPGMSAETRAKVFEPLFSTKNFGVGLGLPTVQKILEQHGGHVRLESEPGVGTVFHLVFPLEKPETCQPATIGDLSTVDIEEA